MALQDVNSGNFGTSNQYITYWTEMIENSTNTTNNTSNVTIRVWIKRTNTGYTTYGTGTAYCTIAGTQYSQAITSSQKITSTAIIVFEKTLDIVHSDDGTGRVDTYAQISMDVVSSGNNGWGFGLTAIPRASIPTLSATTFDMGATITISTNRKSTAFTHTIVYTFGNDQANIAFNVTDSCTWTVPTSLAAQIPNAVSGWGTITCHTYNGSTLIGSKEVNFTANCPSSMVPTATALSVGISGTGRDKTLNKYVQTITKITSSFTATATNYATVSSSSITIKRQSDGADVQAISGTSGTTANPVGLSGVYSIVATVTDSRGRTATISTTITVDAYSPPTVNAFSTARASSPTTTVNATLNVAWSLAASNPTNVTVVGKNNVGTNTTLYTLSGSTAGSINTTQSYANQADSSSYTYTLTVTDSFGNTATATATVGVSFVEFCISKGHGIGVGKIWEQGALDVAGDIFAGTGRIMGRLGFTAQTGGRGSSSNTWVKIATINITNQYADISTTLEVVTNGSGDSLMRACTLRLRVKQQAAMGSAPGIHLVISNPVRFTSSDFVAVTTANTTSITTVELWGQLDLTYDSIVYSVLYSSSTTQIVWYSNSAVVAAYSSGTVTVCQMDDRRKILSGSGGGQSLTANTWTRATWYTPDVNDGLIWQPGGNANMFAVIDEGWYEVYYHVQINQSVNTPFYCQLWGDGNQYGIISPLYCNNNGWNSLSDSATIYLKPNYNYELVIRQEDGSYTRSVDKHRMVIKRL